MPKYFIRGYSALFRFFSYEHAWPQFQTFTSSIHHFEYLASFQQKRINISSLFNSIRKLIAMESSNSEMESQVVYGNENTILNIEQSI